MKNGTFKITKTGLKEFDHNNELKACKEKLKRAVELLRKLKDIGDFFISAIEAQNPHETDFEDFEKEIDEFLKEAEK